MNTHVPASPAAWWNVELPSAAPAISSEESIDAHRIGDLIADDGAVLRRLHSMSCEAFGAPPDTAATFLAIWTMGAVANAVGATWALADAGVVVDPAALQFICGGDMPVTGVHLGGATALVDPAHPWAGAAGVQVVDDRKERRDTTIAALVAAAEPLIDAIHRCATVGRVGLWNQIGDGLVDWLSYRTQSPVTAQIADAVQELVNAPTRRWKATPRAWTVTTPLGAAFAVQKGGCCLEYRFATADDFTGHDGEAYLQQFPIKPGDRITCNTCSLRTRDDAEARQRFWIGRKAVT